MVKCKCVCKEWENGEKNLNGIIKFAWVHGYKYKSPAFEYCPWCGKKLSELNEIKNND